MGLVIAKGLCDKMAGKMNVESEHGKGTAFTISIPFKNFAIIDKLLVPTEDTSHRRAFVKYR